MTNQRIAIAFVLSLFILAKSTHANESTVRCPDIETMRQAANAINDAALVNGNYLATTRPFAILTADTGWFAVVYSITADSINDAIEKARLAMLSISSVSSVFADNLGGTFVCRYENDKIEAINNNDDCRYFKPKWARISST